MIKTCMLAMIHEQFKNVLQVRQIQNGWNLNESTTGNLTFMHIPMEKLQQNKMQSIDEKHKK